MAALLRHGDTESMRQSKMRSAGAVGAVLLLTGCSTWSTLPNRIVVTIRPHCGDEVTIIVSKHSIATQVANNCGGGSIRNERRLSNSEFSRIEIAMKNAQFNGLPEAVRFPTSGASEIPVLADDTEKCIEAWSGARMKRVCGEEYALNHTSEGVRLNSVFSVLLALGRVAEVDAKNRERNEP